MHFIAVGFVSIGSWMMNAWQALRNHEKLEISENKRAVKDQNYQTLWRAKTSIEKSASKTTTEFRDISHRYQELMVSHKDALEVIRILQPRGQPQRLMRQRIPRLCPTFKEWQETRPASELYMPEF